MLVCNLSTKGFTPFVNKMHAGTLQHGCWFNTNTPTPPMKTLQILSNTLRDLIAIPVTTISNLQIELRIAVWLFIGINMLLFLGALALKTMPAEYHKGFDQPFTLVNPK